MAYASNNPPKPIASVARKTHIPQIPRVPASRLPESGLPALTKMWPRTFPWNSRERYHDLTEPEPRSITTRDVSASTSTSTAPSPVPLAVGGKLSRLIGRPAFWVVLLAALFSLPVARVMLRRLPPPPPVLSTIPAFAMTDQQGQPFGTQELLGKVWVADFIFTSCPTACPC